MRHLLFLFLIIATLSASARQVTPEEAATIATEFLCSNASIPVNYAGAAHVKADSIISEGLRQPYYVFNATDNQGFVIISGDNRVQKILGYSDSGSLDYDNLPPQLEELLDRYVEQLSFLPANEAVHPTWNSAVYNIDASGETLLETAEWGQGAPFNSRCPIVDGVQSPTGCVATAMAIIMKYHNWPKQGRKEHYYWNWNNGEQYTADFNEFKPRWDSMLPAYAEGEYSTENADAVAELMYYAGVSANMQYTPNESGASVLGVMTALRRYFRYTAKMDEVVIQQYGDEEWKERVKTDIDNRCPVFYYGQGSGAHAFVIDGYDENGLFHVNWGWNGVANGYFSLDALSPVGQDFSQNQGMVAGIRPATADDAKWSDFFMADGKYGIGDCPIKSINPSLENIEQNEAFTVAVPIVLFPPQVDCDLGMAIVDKDYAIKQVLGSKEISGQLPNISGIRATFENLVAECTIADTDRLQIVVREHGDADWLLVNDSKDVKSSMSVNGNVPYTADVHWEVDSRFGIEFYEMEQWSGNVISAGDINDIVGTFLVGAEYQFHPFEADANRGIFSAVRINDVMYDIRVNKAFTMGDKAIAVINTHPGRYDIKFFGLFPGDEQTASFRIDKAGAFQEFVNDTDCGHITDFALSGTGNAEDYASLSLNMPFIASLDLSAYYPIDGSLPDFCFSGLPNLSKVVLPDNLINIGNGCFLGDALESVVIPESVRYIGSQAFNNYEGYFDAVNMSAVFCKAATPPEVGDIPFGNNSRTVLYVLPGCKEVYASHPYWSTFKEIIEDANPIIDIDEVIVDGIRYKVYPTYAEVVGPEQGNCPDEVILQENVVSNGRTVPVTSIAYHAFVYSTIKKVTVPKSIVNWATGAFSCSYELTDVVIEAPITILQTNTFENCVSLTNISLPNTIEVIGQYAISSARNITRLNIPASLKEIQWNGIIDLSNLEEIVLPEENKNFNLIDGVLYSKDMSWLYLYPSGDCSRERFVIPEGVTNTFLKSISGENLKEVVIPNSMTELSEGFIYYAPNLETLVLHDGISTIGESCFQMPKHLTLGKKLIKIMRQFENGFGESNVYCLNESVIGDFNITSVGICNVYSNYLNANVIFSDEIGDGQYYAVYIPGKADWVECKLDSDNIHYMWDYRFNKEQKEFSISNILPNVGITSVKINGTIVGSTGGIYYYSCSDVPEVEVEYRINDHQDMTTVYSSEFNRQLPVEGCSKIININADSSDTEYRVYNLSGVCVSQNSVKGLLPGIYILKTATSTRKLVIR